MGQQTRKAPVIDAIDVGDEDFNRIMAGLDEAKAIIEGTAPEGSYQTRQVRVPDQVDVSAIRKRLKLTQQAFADHYGFPVGTVRDWEQKRATPERAARILLTIIANRPEVVEEALRA